MLDFRAPENRRELLIRYCTWQHRNGDVDTAIPLMKYIFKRNEFNIEQKLWFCWLYANTYNVASALVLWNEFPDYENVDLERLSAWNTENTKNVQFESDVKWSKYHIDKMFVSYKSHVKGTQDEFFTKVCNSDDPKVNYENLRTIIINDFHKMGRYICFFYMQALKHCCDLNIEPTDMQYGYSCQSPTDGLSMIMNREDMMSRLYQDSGRSRIKQNITYTDSYIAELNEFTDDVLAEMHERYPETKDFGYFELETALCSIKKLTRRRDGRYLGYYLDRLMKNVEAAEKLWPGVDYDIVRDWVSECLPQATQDRIENWPVKSRMNEWLDTGNLTGFSEYPDLINE